MKINTLAILKFLISVIGVLIIVVILSLAFLPYFLRKVDITIGNIDYHFPSSLSIQNFELDKRDFKLKIDSAELSLSAIALLKGDFIGKSIKASGINIYVETDTSESDFSYSSIPYLSFEEIHFKRANLGIYGVDTIRMTFPDLHAHYLLWNDSIQVKDLIYSDGSFFSSSHLQTTEKSEKPASDIIVPSGVPFFKVQQLSVIRNKITLHNSQSKTELSDIHLSLKGINTKSGADLKLMSAKLTIQDSIGLEIRSEKIFVQNLKGTGVHGMHLNMPGVNLHINEFALKQKNKGSEIYLKLNPSVISPTLINYFINGSSIINNNSPDFNTEGEFSYRNDSLLIHKYTLNVLNYSQIVLKGNVSHISGDKYFDLEISPLCISGEELTRILALEIPSKLKDVRSCENIKLKGYLNNIRLNGEFNYNHNKFAINAHLKKEQDTDWHLKLTATSEIVDFSKLLSDTSVKLKVFQLSMNGDVNLNELNNFRYVSLNATCDSLRNNSILLEEPTLKGELSREQSHLEITSFKQNWNVTIKNKSRIDADNNLDIQGSIQLSDLGILNETFNGHKLSGDFNLIYHSKSDSTHLILKLKNLSHISDERKVLNFKTIEAEFEKIKNSYQLNIASDQQNILTTRFDDSFVKWLKQPQPELDKAPNYYLRTSFVIDSNYTESILGKKIHLQVNTIEISSGNSVVESKIDIPIISFENYFIRNLKSNTKLTKLEKMSDFEIRTVQSPVLIIDSINSRIHESSRDSFEYTFKAKLPSVNQYLSFAGGVFYKERNIKFLYNNSNILRFGAQEWVNAKGNELSFNLNNKELNGKLKLYNEDQLFQFESDLENMTLQIQKLKLGPIVNLVLDNHKAEAELNFKSDFKIAEKELRFNGNITNTQIDSIALGYSEFNGLFSSNTSSLQFISESSAWSGTIVANSTPMGDEAQLNVSRMNLSKLDSVLNLFSDEYDLAGNIATNLKVSRGEKTNTNGYVKFDGVAFSSKNFASGIKIDQQQINITNETLRFNKFIIEDKGQNKMMVNGHLKLTDNKEIMMDIKGDNFILLNNQDPNSKLQGKLVIESDLSIRGTLNEIGINGKLNVLKGGNIFYTNKKSVSLAGSQDVVNFISFEEEDSKKRLSPKRINQGNINWNVNVNLGETEIYVLFSKSTEEYAKLKAHGELQLRQGKGITPNVFGNITSNEGKVFYNIPLISNLDLNIQLAKATWKGDIKEPVLNFKGVETFRVTPNEMSPDLEDKTNKVPVNVIIGIDDKSLNNLELNFDINSGNADVQNMLSALPAETKESYALSMLVHGKVNSESKNGNSTMEPIVNKLNEIARRNFKNSDLSFHTDNTSNQNADGTKSAEKIGYNFSKEFYNNKLKVMVGGNFDVGATTNETKSAPLGTIELDYLLKEEPNITLKLKRENAYRGPIEGQVDESSVSINFNKRYNNLFLLKPRSNKDSTAIKNK